MATDPETPTARAIVDQAPDLAMVEVDGETIVWEPQAAMLHHLDPVATAVWTAIDGDRPLTDLAGDLAERFEVDVEVVLDDVLALVDRLVADDLLVVLGAADGPDEDGA